MIYYYLNKSIYIVVWYITLISHYNKYPHEILMKSPSVRSSPGQDEETGPVRDEWAFSSTLDENGDDMWWQ